MSHPPGWYPDPRDASGYRWWDGSQWSQHTRPIESSPASVQSPPQVGVAAEIASATGRLAALKREIESVEEALEIQSFGFYRPRYGFPTASQYAAKLEQVRQHQKQLIKSKQATWCDTKWAVSGSVAEGQKMIDRMAKLMLRAFNGECDAAIAKCKYDNVVVLEQRITKSCEEINKLGHSNRILITTPYYESKLAELHLVHEHREKVQEEKDEERRRREELREEEKARVEIERAQQQAEKEEAQYQRALAKAQADLANSTGKQHEKLEALVTRLENELKDALDRKAKVIARAQLTKSGHVYVLSNHGSFGEGVYKIGLTRRLDPYERVDELGDASVPFPFDVHAIIYAPDAPALEHALHKEFAHRRVNMVNQRKEYFRVTLDEIRAAVAKLHGTVTFVLTPEAEEWRKTRAMMEAANG